MDDAKRERVIAAETRWRAARQAYWDEADEYVGQAWLGDESAPTVNALTTESWVRLMRLREAERDALQAYHDALDS